MKKTVLLFAGSLVLQYALGQTIFTYGNKPVSKQEFMTAFNRNPGSEADKKKALNEYLDLYINYKLKVQAAYDEHLDEASSFLLESKNFKDQVAMNIINEEANIKMLIQQAFQRSQKDIHVAQVFIPIPKGENGEQQSQEIQQAYAALKAGKKFEEVVSTFSTDGYTKEHKGDIGYITVFTLQYAIENEVYSLKPGQYSSVYQSKYGYHIFKNIEERSATGRRKIQQLLINIPPGASEEQKKRYEVLADSLYVSYQRGVSFEKLIAQYNTGPNRGSVEIGVGDYDPSFESQVFALRKAGDISKPFATSFGYHIVKLVEILPVSKTLDDPIAYAAIQQKVEKDSRLTIARSILAKKWLNLVEYKPAIYDSKELWAFTDSVISNRPIKAFKNIKDSSLLFSFTLQKVYVADWILYVRSARSYGNTGSYKDLFSDFLEVSTTRYYTDHLELYNTGMQQQLKEFNEANLLFASMDKNIWRKASEDTLGLTGCYEQHKAKYQWASGVSALVVTSFSKELADEVAAKIKAAPSNWRTIAGSYGSSVVADSGRYEFTQLPVKEKIESMVGFLSFPEKSGQEGAYTFLYVTATHPQQEQRSFGDARGMVINDYQQQLEEQWLVSLKKQYPVVINKEVWKTIQ